MTNRSPTSVFFLTMVTFGIYGIVWYSSTRDEMVAKGADIPGIIMAFIPILNIIWMWNYAQGVERVTNGSTSAGSAFIMRFFGPIGMAITQGDFNKVG